ncbi:biotin--[acetyl-CoA-carboxylase] ligase [Mycolicibacterium sp. P9-64]|uniref:biotin--[acetyl-CoA-carboxylase] ligase n=1 Tax=Mycolicibacterium sp. P9-64 TaxID=2024612 RepID=UPI0011EC7FAE|nr:biotin--[acetyl-CoA-carboxylase] ligase [Mycolicibacterium sp. P9-64]KAA0080245.1 biotin--[acetyl-CoA-carboxylase] ligase [Mycolicibacterium sp. P9-64]
MTTDDWRNAVDATALRDVLVHSPWQRIDVVAETGSTNADLIARAAAGEDIGGAVLIAEHQTAGRGRNGRTWTAVPGAQISMSVGVSVDGIPSASWGWIPLIAGLAVLDAVGPVSGVAAGLKWPNDVLARPPAQGKLAGILAEVAAPAPAVVVGIGLNVSFNADELPDPGATSLLVLGGRPADRRDLIVAILEGLERRLAGLRAAQGADAALIAEYTARSLTVGARVRATMPGDREVVGDAKNVDDQGRLVIDTGTETVVVSAGDIVHLRPLGEADSG